MAEIIREAPPVALDATVLGLTVLVSLTGALFVALLPMARLWPLNLQGTMQSNSRSTSASRRLRATSGFLVTAQTTMALMLVIGAALLIRSYSHVVAVDPGFAAKKFVHARIALSSSYNSGASARSARDRILAAIREIPGVEAVTTMPGDALKGIFPPSAFSIRGATVAPDAQVPTAWLMEVAPEFFETMGIRILEGRGFTSADIRGSRRVYIVDRNFAEKHFPGRTAVGEGFERSRPDDKPDEWPLIIGVAEVASFSGLDDRGTRPFIYTASSFTPRLFSLVVRTARPMGDMAPLMREALRRIDPTLPLYDVKTLNMALDDLLDTRRGIMGLIGVFASIALVLSAVGIYGVLAYAVSQRTREIAIRGAIGATRAQIIGLILSQGLRRTGVGLILGLAGALALTRFLQSHLFGVGPNDPVIFVAATLVLLAVALLASWLPAWRAAKVDPVIALRAD